MLIQEVILENFMSYEYARVPFRSGVNVIGGPNGAGKSSLLLAISVALGQSYTERSRKLSDLIRWGKDRARVTLILDNSRRGGKRPIRKYNKDQLFLTRGLRRDGKYWFELENRAATKQEVDRLLGKFGVDPENMLIIMHQNMVEQFSVLSNIEKLRMVEAAVGFEPFRENVLQAQRKLTRILSQEESVGKLLESAEQTLHYWREQHEKYQEKKQLQTKRRFLNREVAWAEVERRENVIKGLQSDRYRQEETLNKIEEKTKNTKNQLDDQQVQRQGLRSEVKTVFNERINLEHSLAETESATSIFQQLLKETSVLESEIRKNASQFKLLRSENLLEILENSRRHLSEISEKVRENRDRMENLEEISEKVISQILENRIELALLQHRREDITANLEKVDAALKEARNNLDNVASKAKQTGARIAVLKSSAEILDDIHIIDGHLAALADVSENMERMYESYSRLYIELKEKAEVVAENRRKTLEEIKTRLQTWRNVMQSLLERVNLEYQKIMGQTLATGEVRLSNGHDIENAGLEILVGFKGGKPVALDAYTQSGGERTTATMSFLLALQQHVRSPFRAVDEYDIHMDPKNREMIARILLSTIKDATAQYIIITPSQITFAQKDANIITVQNVEGKSIVREVA
jgi:chromosome segregation ATPase